MSLMWWYKWLLFLPSRGGAGDPSHGEGVMEPNSDGDGDAGKMDEGESPPKADEGMLFMIKRRATSKWMNPWERESKEESQSPPRMSTTSLPPKVTHLLPWRKRRRRGTQDERAEQGGFGCNAKAMELAASALTSRHARSETTSCKDLGEH